jgi:putative aldouronate transport system permease protein
MDALKVLPGVTTRYSKMESLKKNVVKYRGLLLMLLIPVAWFIVYYYVPIYGLTLAFKRFRILEGIGGSPWVGFEHFERLFSSPKFFQVLRNTLVLAFFRLVFYMPMPIIFALLLNEIRHPRYKKISQSLTYLPHFLSWVVVGGIVRNLLSPVNGLFNYFVTLAGNDPISFLLQPVYFRPIVILSSIWRDTGWGSIVILAAITNIDPDLYSSCEIDGGGRWAQLWYITLPGILPIVLMIYILRTGRLLKVGFDQILNLYNPAVYRVGDIIQTYTYRVGLIDFDFSYATAIGFFINVVAFIVLILSNWIVKRIDAESSLW